MNHSTRETAARPDHGTADIRVDKRGLLRATVQRHRGTVIVSVAGEADASNDRAFAQLLRDTATTTAAPGWFIVDLRGLGFIGCSALAVLAREAERCRRRSVCLYLVGHHQSLVTRAVGIAGLRWVLPIYPSIQAALSRADSRPVVL